DCNGNPLPVSEAKVVNHKGDTLSNIAINKFGNGKFLLHAEDKTPKVSFLIKGKRIEKYLPVALPYGITLEVNSYVFEDKTIVKIRTNQKSIGKLKNENLFLVVHQ